MRPLLCTPSSHTCRTPHRRDRSRLLWISCAPDAGRQPHLTDAIATDAGPFRHTWRTGLPHLPDTKCAKPLIYRDKDECKVSKALKDSEDLDLTYPQTPRKKGCPASVAIMLVAPSICRFVFYAPSEPTMLAKPVLEAT